MAPCAVSAGIVMGIAALGVSVARAITRERWCRRAARGEIAGWRLRHHPTVAGLQDLRCVDGARRGVIAILERVHTRGEIYRSSAVVERVATLRVPYERYAQALKEA